MRVIGAEDRDLDKRLRRPAGRCRLGRIVAPDAAAADRIGLGQAITERRLGLGEFVLQARDVADRPRRPAGGDILQGRQVIFVAIRVGHQLEAHGRHADEISDLLLLDQPQRLARIPFGHHHHAAADDEAVEHHRDLAGDMEQGHAEQGARRSRGFAVVLDQQAQQGHQAGRIAIGRRRHRAVGRQGALGLAGRARGEQDRRIVFGVDFRQLGGGRTVEAARQTPGRAAGRRRCAALQSEQPPLSSRRARGSSAMINAGSVKSSACLSSCFCHQPLISTATAPALTAAM